MKARIGRAAYILAGAKHLRDTNLARARVDVDGKKWFRGRIGCVLIGNVGSLFGGVTVFENARPDDGRLEIGVVTAKGALQWIRALASTAAGTPERSPFVEMTSGQKFDIRLDRPVAYELDGGDRPPAKRLRTGPSRRLRHATASWPTKLVVSTSACMLRRAPAVAQASRRVLSPPTGPRSFRGVEAVGAAVGAEPVVVAVVRDVGWRIARLDLHAAHRVRGVTSPAAEPMTVAVQPVQVGRDADEEDVEERRVVPVEAGLDDVARSGARDEAGAVEEAFDREAQRPP